MSDELSAKPLSSLQLPWKTRASLAVASVMGDVTRRKDGTLRRFIFNLFELKLPACSKYICGVRTSDVTIDTSRNLWVRIFYPNKKNCSTGKCPLIVFFHGGGFTFLSANSLSYDLACRRIARSTGAVIVSVNYRLSPENRFPAPYDDGYDVLEWVDIHAKEFLPNVDISKSFLAGDSAGANIAHHVAKRVCETKREVFQAFRIIGLVLIQAFFGGENYTQAELRLIDAPLVNIERTNWHWKAFLPEGTDRNHEACNIFGPKSSGIQVSGFPVTMVVVGGFDPLQDWQRKYYDGMVNSGLDCHLIEYPNGIHAFYLFPELPESQLFLMDMKDFMEKQIKRSEMI